MSFRITYKKTEFGSYEMKYDYAERATPSPSILLKNDSLICLGESFKEPLEFVGDLNWIKDPSLINRSDLAVAVIRFDEDDCYIATNYSCLETLYVFHDEATFVVSDSFWEIVQIVQPSIGDIDWDVVSRKIALCGALCETRTMVKGLEWTPGNYWGHFDARTGSFNSHQFAHFTHSENEVDFDSLVDRIDLEISEGIRSLVERHGDWVFGLGLSGGLDSRAALHYLKQSGAKLACFNQCTLRPHKLLKASSVKRAHQIAAASGVSCIEVDWRPDDILWKKETQLKLAPLTSPDNSYKYEDSGIPDFDCLITGGAGSALIVGGLPDGASDYSIDDVVSYATESMLGVVSPYSVDDNVIHGFLESKGIRLPRRESHDDIWNKLVDSSVVDSVRSVISDYIQGLFDAGLSSADVLFEFDSVFSIGMTRSGAFETRFGQVRSFCYNRPFIIDATNDMPSRYIEGRKLLRALIKNKMPEYAGISEENYGSSDGEKRSCIKEILGRLDFLLRGSGVISMDWHARNSAVREAFYADMTNSNKWFYSHYDVMNDVDQIWDMSPTRKNAIWDMKRFIDCLETKRYLNW